MPFCDQFEPPLLLDLRFTLGDHGMLQQSWILPTVQKKWRVARRYVDGIVSGKFCYTEAPAPHMWVQFDVRPQEVLQHANCHFTLTICLRMKR